MARKTKDAGGNASARVTVASGGTPAERAEELRREIRRHDRLYYLEARPVIADEAYDALFRELETLEAAHPELATADSPTRRVAGAPAPELATFEHEGPMLSLDSTREVEEVREFDGRVKKGLARESTSYVVEPKFDGVSVELVYQDGALRAGATRRDGLHP